MERAVLASVMAACVAALAAAASRPGLYLASPGMSAVYLGGPALLLLACAAALRAGREARLALLLLLAASGTGLYIVEAGLLAWSRRPPPPPPEDALAASLREAEAAGRPLRPRLTPSELVEGRLSLPAGAPFPLGGVSRREVAFCREGGPLRSYVSDEHGFNNPAGAHRRVSRALVGDSFVEGACVPREAALGGRLGALAAGIGGAGPLTELGILREFVAPLRPPVVLWFYFPNDMKDLASERAHPALTAYLRPGTKRLRERQAEVDAAWAAALAARPAVRPRAPAPGPEPVAPGALLLRFLRLYYLRTALMENLLMERYPITAAERELLAEYGRVLSEARDETRAWSGRLYFVYLPEWLQFRAPRKGDKFRPEVLALAREAGLDVIDVHEAFARQPRPLELFALDGNSHYNERGYGVAAAAVAAALEPSPR